MPFNKPERSCVSCHEKFADGKFDHKLIGLTFSEAHEGLECGNCHAKNDFKALPVCTDCHDDKSVPEHYPGKKW
jgi:hypothetical protein